MAKQIVGSWSDWSGKLKDLFRQIDDGSIALPQIQAFLEHRNPFDLKLPDIDWQKVYEFLGISAEYDIQENPNLWAIPVIKGITCNKVVEALRKLKVEVYTYVDDLDKDVVKNDRDPSNDSYTISFKRTVEADEENKNLSANTLAKQGHKGITLLERLLLELGYYLAIGQHLDVENITLCSGSRRSVGGVPSVYWHSDYRKVRVDWYYPDFAHGDLRSRSAVS